MKSRRGTSIWPGNEGTMIERYSVGDVVVSTTAGSLMGFTGEVVDVSRKTNKVLVAWGGGSVVQHGPDEIMLHPNRNSNRAFDASVGRRVRNAKDVEKINLD